ncbi:retrotransposon protein, putative, ty3-gypsy subclass [Tanacetum coccineum]
MDNQPPSREIKLSLTEIITKYMEESAKKEAEHDEWIRKFQESAEINHKGHDEIICNLESKVKALTGEVEGRATGTKIGECKAIFTKEGLPIYYVVPYEPSILFPKRLEQHVEEALVYKAMESLNRIKLPLKGQDPGSFTLPCSIGKLTFNALADLGGSISIVHLSMFKRIGIEGLKPINVTIEMADRTKSTPRGIVENLLVKIDKFFFLVDFIILDMEEDLRIPIILGRPLLATAHAKFSGTANDEDDLDGITEYLELKSHDGFMDVYDEAYKERMCKLFGMTYKKPSLILIEKVEVTRYTIGPG